MNYTRETITSSGIGRFAFQPFQAEKPRDFFTPTTPNPLNNADSLRSSFYFRGGLMRANIERQFQTSAAQNSNALNGFVEKYPASQGLNFSETKSAETLAYSANTDETYQFPDGKQWRVIDTRNTGNTGFRAVALKPVDETDNRVIIAFAGTNPTSLHDWENNIGQAGGNTPAQYRQAVDLAGEYQNLYGNNVILTGHSLGGGLASYASLQTGLRATAINSAALSPNNLGGNALFHPSLKRNPNITQYYVPGEVLTNLDNIDLFDARPGDKISIPGRYNRWIDPRAGIGNHLLGNLATDVPAPVRID
jgi:hypothetical protein